MRPSLLKSTCFLDWMWMRGFHQGFCHVLAKYDSARLAQGRDRCYPLCTRTSRIPKSLTCPMLHPGPSNGGGENSCRVSLPVLMTGWNRWAKQWWEWRGRRDKGTRWWGQTAHKPSLGRQEAGRLTDYVSRGSKPSSHAPASRGLQLQITLSKNILLIMLRQPKHRPCGMRFYQLHSSIKLALITYIITYWCHQKFSRRLKTVYNIKKKINPTMIFKKRHSRNYI